MSATASATASANVLSSLLSTVAPDAAAGAALAPDSPADVLRLVLPLVAALLTAIAVDRLTERRGHLPPGFLAEHPGGRWRRAAASGLLALFFWVGVFAAFGISQPPGEVDLSSAGAWTLFALHGVIAACLLAWGALAYPRHLVAETPLAALVRAVGLREERPWREVGVGFATGLLIWGAVLVAVTALAAVLSLAGRDDWLPEGPPELVLFIAGQPFWVRLLGSLSAGFVEETFFRGFLQPRVGVALSTVLFALAHWSYGEPFMLVGVTLLSLTYAGLYRWRSSVWAAATAHAVFDGVQLLVLMPLALETLPEATAVAAWWPPLW